MSVCVCMCSFSTHSPYLFKPDRLNQHGEKRFIIIFIKMYRFSYEQHNNNSSGTKQPTPDSCMWICYEPTLRFFFSLLLALGLMFTIFPTYCDGATDASRHSHYNNATKVIRICYSQHIIWFHTKTGANFFFPFATKDKYFFSFLW